MSAMSAIWRHDLRSYVFFWISNSLCRILSFWKIGFEGASGQAANGAAAGPNGYGGAYGAYAPPQSGYAASAAQKSHESRIDFFEKPFVKKRSGLGDSYSGYGAPYMPAAQEQCKTKWLAS